MPMDLIYRAVGCIAIRVVVALVLVVLSIGAKMRETRKRLDTAGPRRITVRSCASPQWRDPAAGGRSSEPRVPFFARRGAERVRRIPDSRREKRIRAQ